MGRRVVIIGASSGIGVVDLLIAFSIAPFIGVADHLAAQWYVPAFVGPFMIVTHMAYLAALLRSRTQSRARDASACAT